MDLRELSQRFSLSYEEVENLFLYYTKIPRYQLYLSPPSDFLSQEFISLLKKRREGYPIQYLTKTAFFLDLELEIDERVFIPRPETEGLVVLITQFFAKNEALKILEIGTGSGNIAISLARFFPNGKIIATDISESALSVAKINIARYKLEERISLVKSDLFSFFVRQKDSFDFVVSNPPYIPSAEIKNLAREIRDFEPRIALDGGPDGCFYIQRIMEEGRRYLKEKGRIFLEIDPRAKERILSLAPNAKFYYDLAQICRYAVID